MRLVCPNCDAKYEVPDDAIPEAGRDVQCANCNHAWFQPRAAIAAETPVAHRSFAPPDAFAAPTGGKAAAEMNAELPAGTMAEPGAPDPAGTVAPVAPAAGKGYGVDDSVLAILREEAEREAQVRKSEVRPLETQTDLGLEDAAATADPERVLLPREPDPQEDFVRPSARRDLLPDVEEINSTLRPSDRPVDPDADVEALPDLNPGRSSFRSGFVMMLAVAILGLVAYLAAPQLSEQVPALKGTLTSYVAFVDMLRLQLDGLMQSATVAIKGDG